MSDFTTPEGCETPAITRPAAPTLTQSRVQAPVLNRLLTVYGLWIAVAALYWPSSLALNALWTSPAHKETYTHGYMVLLISLWLIFRDRKQLAAAPVRPAPQALVALILLSALWVWAWRAAIQEGHVILLPFILLAAVSAALGWRVARLLAFPVGYLYFAMPIWSSINGFVQTLSAKASGVLIWVTGLPAFVQGDYVHLPGGTIEIATTCSGLHALIVGLALATLYGKMSDEPLRRRLTWIGVMGALSLVVNWVRIFTVLVAADATDMHSSLVRNHYWLGWWLFAAAFAGFLWWTGRKPAAGSERPAVSRRQAALSDSGFGFGLAGLTATLFALAVLPGLAYGMDWAHSDEATSLSIQWPAPPPGWTGPYTAIGGAWHPYFRDPSGESLRLYSGPDGRVEAFAVAYRVQTQRAKLLSYWNSLLGPVHRHTLRNQWVRTVESPSGRWQEMLAVGSAGKRSLIWSRYRVGNRLFVRPRLSQLWYGLNALVLRPPISSLIALRADCVPDCSAARTLLRRVSKLQPVYR